MYEVGYPPVADRTLLNALLTVVKVEVLLSVLATSVNVVSSKVYKPKRHNVSPDAAVVPQYIVIVVIVVVTSGTNGVK